MDGMGYILPETNITPENGGSLQKEIPIGTYWKPPFLGSGRIAATSHDQKPQKVAFWKGKGTPYVREI